MGMRLLEISTAVDQREFMQYKNEPGYMNAVRSTACRALAENLSRDSSLYQRIDPPKDDLFSPIIHKWTIGVQIDLAEVRARMMQMDEARAEGRAQAAAIVRAAADRFENTDGGCKWVIMGALRDAAKKIDAALT